MTAIPSDLLCRELQQPLPLKQTRASSATTDPLICIPQIFRFTHPSLLSPPRLPLPFLTLLELRTNTGSQPRLLRLHDCKASLDPHECLPPMCALRANPSSCAPEHHRLDSHHWLPSLASINVCTLMDDPAAMEVHTDNKGPHTCLWTPKEQLWLLLLTCTTGLPCS